MMKNTIHKYILYILVSQSGPSSGSAPPVGQYPGSRTYIWQGILEWIEKGKGPTDTQKTTRQVPCQVSASCRDGEPEL